MGKAGELENESEKIYHSDFSGIIDFGIAI